MPFTPSRRDALALGAIATAVAADTPAAASGAPSTPDLIPPDAAALRQLHAALARAPRRRDFKTVPRVLVAPDQWDSEALSLLMAYRDGPKQVWDNTEGLSWLHGMNNAINPQVFSFRHPNFLAVSATHGSAGVYLLDQAAWDKYGLAKLVNAPSAANTTLAPDTAPATGDPQSPDGALSGEGLSVSRLMRRGAVMLACHNALYDGARMLHRQAPNPDKLDVGALAADLTNHLAPGVILTPGIVATLPELQRVGYAYIK